MKSKTPALTVEDRVRIELSAHREENPGIPISVAELCRRAGVSRASLYEFHRELIEEIIKERRAVIKRKKLQPKNRDYANHVSNLKNRNQALLYLCLELTRELHLLRARLGQTRGRRRR